MYQAMEARLGDGGTIVPAALTHYVDTMAPSIRTALASTMLPSALAPCDCYISAIPGSAAAPTAQLTALHAQCAQDPATFLATLRSAGVDPVCAPDPGAAAAGPGAPPQSGVSRPVMIAGAVGALAVLGLGAYLFMR